jgi:two-component system, LytTR family, sensor kinase
MKTNKQIYWLCQIGGWLFYFLVNIFFCKVFGQELTSLLLGRIILSIILGLAFTHVLRYLVKQLKMLPPIFGTNWFKLIGLIVFVCIISGITSSFIVEVFKLWDEKIRISFSKRVIYNLLNDSPILLVWVLIYYVWHYFRASQKNELDRIKFESLVKELELKTIKSHINPHFIFNALNSIRALIDENPERARKAVTELSNILRSSMLAEKLETATLEKELSITKDYLALEYIRFEDRLHIEFDIDEDTLNQQVPPMMLQTLVENAIKHGISKQTTGGTVRIISDFIGDNHELIVQNTGQLDTKINHQGFGIASTYDRLNILFGKKAKFELSNIENMVQAKIIMPVKM